MENPTRVIVTGASGFSGKHISAYLATNPAYQVLSHFGRRHFDLTDRKILEFAFSQGADVIVHCAASSPWEYVKVSEIADNVAVVKNLISYALNVGVEKIIYFSSTSLYGTVKDGLLTTHSPRLNPDVYGETKHICEHMLAESGIRTIALRLPGIVGNGSRRNWLSRVMEKAKRQEHITIYSEDAWFNNVVHIDFIAELVEFLIQCDLVEKFQPILCASREALTIREVAKTVMGSKGLVIGGGPAEKEPFMIDVSVLQQVFRTWTTKDTLERYVGDER